LEISNPDFGFILDRRTDLDIRGVGITEGVQFGVHASFLVALLTTEGHELIRALEAVLETGKRTVVRCRDDRLAIYRQGGGLVINYERIRLKQKTESIPASMTIGVARELLTRMRTIYGAEQAE
jgi:hypothetical protein